MVKSIGDYGIIGNSRTAGARVRFTAFIGALKSPMARRKSFRTSLRTSITPGPRTVWRSPEKRSWRGGSSRDPVTGDLEVTGAEGNHVPHTYCFVWKETHPETELFGGIDN
jgi:hypothetical protein